MDTIFSTTLGKQTSEGMIESAEEFFVHCIGNKSQVRNFGDLRKEVYHKKSLHLDLEKLPPTAYSIHLHIMRAFLYIKIDPSEYGYELLEDEERLSPLIVYGPCLPEDFPGPCSCQKCDRANICPCRRQKISCCEFCKCNDTRKF